MPAASPPAAGWAPDGRGHQDRPLPGDHVAARGFAAGNETVSIAVRINVGCRRPVTTEEIIRRPTGQMDGRPRSREVIHVLYT